MAKEQEDYLHVSSFKVQIDGKKEEVFESVAGLGLSIEDIAYQGEKNLFANRPGRCNANDIVLTRRYRKDKELYDWIKATKEGKKEFKEGSVILLDRQEKEIARFNFFGAWPKAWHGPTFSKQAGGNDTLLETIVLSVGDVELA